jgi:hypothetical protein
MNAIKDDGSNTRSDVTALDRNLSGLSNANTTAIMQAADRTNLHNNIVEDARFRENRQDGLRNTDAIMQAADRQKLHDNMANEARFRDNRDTTNRAFDSNLAENRRNTEFVLNSVERNGTATLLGTQTTANSTQLAIERNGAANAVATERTSAALAQAIERNGTAGVVSVEQNAGIVRDLINQQAREERANASTLRSEIVAGLKDTLLASKDTDLRILGGLKDTENMINATNYNVLKTQKDLETIAARNAADAARDAANAVRDALTNRTEIMRQASDIAASSTRDLLNTRADIMRQAAENTAAIQIEALKTKDLLASKMDHHYDSLKSKITDTALLQRDIDGARLRDNANDYRIENAILKERHHHHHGHDGWRGDRHSDGHIHNNLYSGHGYPYHYHHRDERRGGGGDFGGFGGFGGPGGFAGPGGIQSNSNSN